jgi:hypothetical protein
MKTVIEMAGEVDSVTKTLLDRKCPQGMSHDVFLLFLERFAEIVREDAIVDKRQQVASIAKDEIIEMYLQVSKELCNDTEWCWAGVGEPLQMFAKLVADKEREACAKLCDSTVEQTYISGYTGAVHSARRECAAAIRARGQA